jgi:hypothetical protein
MHNPQGASNEAIDRCHLAVVRTYRQICIWNLSLMEKGLYQHQKVDDPGKYCGVAGLDLMLEATDDEQKVWSCRQETYKYQPR